MPREPETTYRLQDACPVLDDEAPLREACGGAPGHSA